MLAGVRSHPGPIMFLSGDLPKGVMSAWSSQAGFVEKAGPKSPCWFKTFHLQICSQIAWVSSKEWNGLLDLPILPCYRGNLFWE